MPARRRYPATVALGQRIRARRKELNLTQRALAERAEMDWSYVSQTERGERNIALLNILRLSTALETDVGNFLRGLTLDPPGEPS